MEANKFATMLHRNTNKISIILIYTILEWILILFLLLNSLFSHLITRFAIYFGLKPPCLWCSRVDHVFGIKKTSYQDLVCEIHATEISELAYCSKHKKLAQSRYLCKNCLFSQTQSSDDIEHKIALVSSIEEKTENGEINSKCLCCDASLSNDLYPPYLLYDINRGNEDTEGVDEDENVENPLGSPSRFQCKEIEVNEDDIVETNETVEEEEESVKANAPDSPQPGMDILQSQDSMLSNSPLKLENWCDFDDHFLVTIESTDSLNSKKRDLFQFIEADNGKRNFDELWEFESQMQVEGEAKEPFVMLSEGVKDLINKLSDQSPRAHVTQAIPFNDSISEGIELIMVDSDEAICLRKPSRLIEREVPNEEESSSRNYADSGNGASSTAFRSEDEQSLKETEELSIERTRMVLETIDEHREYPSSQNPEANGSNDESFRDVENHIPLLERKELLVEEALDGSCVSEMNGGEGIATIEHLKSVLREERNARCALYEELEEERSANAIASKQTMEMITRLQEEKATMQMEALQYQRMMDEQSEYDQEALQLLNELVVKVEKEKNELQMELEICRKKVLHYEARERRLMKRKSTTSDMSRTHSASFSNSEDGDHHLHVDFDHESVDEESYSGHPESSNHTPANGVLNLEEMDLENSKHISILDESLADFEAEKLSILEKLKELEEKLFTLSDEEGEYFQDVKPVVLFPEENGNGFSNDHEIENGSKSPHANGFHYMNGSDEEPIPVSSHKKSPLSQFVEVNKRLAIEEEVENVYERLHALEADREFLKQSISSLKKGDKGMDLLQEILQYLRDLRSVELSTRKLSDASLV
ncbi:hypothetical protein ACHQM5_005463 [Ranunculus cassubicifolius]